MFSGRGSPSFLMLRLCLTIFLSAFLLFQVQPLIGRYILPWFGGGPAVWTACMLFFQLLLLVGYAYAHLISSRLGQRTQAWLHMALLAASLWFLPIEPDASVWKPLAPDEPTGYILVLLLATVGMPYVLLSSTAPLIQRWFSLTYPGQSPYRLYALSNAGSLLALLTYPFVMEPSLTLGAQVDMWSWAFAVFAILCGWSAVRFARLPAPAASTAAAEDPAPSFPSGPKPALPTILLWLGLAAMGSVMLLATTNQMCQEVAVIPFLWVLPLSLYLLTFIISFEHDRWYRRRPTGLLLAASSVGAVIVLAGGAFIPLWIQIIVHSVTVFACCLSCHGELARAKPHPRHLTLFYLAVAAGGALGGTFVAVGAPRLFSGYWEYHLGLAGCVLLVLIAWYRDCVVTRLFRRPQDLWIRVGVVYALLVLTLLYQTHRHTSNALAVSRNFYGVLRVDERVDLGGPKLTLTHGRIVHGYQYQAPQKRLWPTAYYGPDSGVGLTLTHHPNRKTGNPHSTGLRVGIVGLGAGTIAAYGQANDYFRFYEIDPDVLRYSDEHFTYRSASAARLDVVLGDARIRMEREIADGSPQRLDVLVVDAFSSDAIPIHLITRESAALYWQHLNDDGVLLFHISNRSLDLAPITRALAEDCGCEAVRIHSPKDETRGVSKATWVALTRNQAFLTTGAIRNAAAPWNDDDRPPLLWTDDYAALWQVLKFNRDD